MIVLGIDGALGNFTCAVVRDGAPLAQIETPAKSALEAGLGAVAEALRDAGVMPAQVERIGTGIGPGGFTGLRIALTYAKSLAQAWRVPLVGVSSFDLLELDLALVPPVLTVVTGRPGVISVRYRDESAERRASGYVEQVLAELEPLLRGTRVNVVGAPEDVLAALGERGIDVHHTGRIVRPPALAVARIAATQAPARTPHELRADYGELPAAKPPAHR